MKSDPRFKKALELADELDQEAALDIGFAEDQARQNFATSSATTAAQTLRDLNAKLRLKRDHRFASLIVEIESLIGVLRGD